MSQANKIYLSDFCQMRGGASNGNRADAMKHGDLLTCRVRAAHCCRYAEENHGI